jgi:hypothetical protein
MLEVARSEDKKEANIVPSAQYNMGRAYFMVSSIASSGYDYHTLCPSPGFWCGTV